MNQPSSENTLVVIVTYNPDKRFIGSLNVIKGIFENILVVDNNSINDVGHLINDSKIHLIKNIENLGIARALNIGADFAIREGVSWILMLDQDTIPRVDILEIFNNVYLAFPEKEKIGQIGVSFDKRKNASDKYTDVTTLITSGTLLSLEVYRIVGEFRNDFFIDSVDFEYSLRIKKNGYHNLLSPEVAINHRLGDSKQKKILFLNFKSTNHSVLRRYYMARNHAIISSDYFFTFPFWVLKKNLFFIISVIQILLAEDQKKIKLANIYSGLKNGLIYKKNSN